MNENKISKDSSVNVVELSVEELEACAGGRIAVSIGGWTFGQVDCEGGMVWGATDGRTVYAFP